MAELEFERRLERLFAEPPVFADEAAFVAKVERRLNRGWNLRRWTIGVAGFAGGVIGASQLVWSNLAQHVEGGTGGAARVLEAGVQRLGPQAELLSVLSQGGTMVWVGCGLALLAVGFLVTRVIEEI